MTYPFPLARMVMGDGTHVRIYIYEDRGPVLHVLTHDGAKDFIVTNEKEIPEMAGLRKPEGEVL